MIAREDTPGDKRLVAYAVAESAVLDSAVLRTYLKSSLPDYMIPAAFVQLDTMPTTPNGKVNRRALPAPAVETHASARATRPARTHVERQLVEIWQDVFQSSSVGIDDNFWDLGGHSLLAVKLMGHISRVFGRRLPLNALYEAPTIAQLANRVEDHGNTDGRHTLVSLQASGSKPPLYWIPGGAALGLFTYHQHFVERLGPEQPIYGLGSSFPKTVTDVESVEERAAKYLKLIQRVQPHGPYHLVGVCAGGTIAFEMAQQLLRGGETTRFLCMIDCWCPAFSWGTFDTLRFKAGRLLYHLNAAREQKGGLLAYGRARLASRHAVQVERRNIADGVERAKRDGFTDTETEDYGVITRVTKDVVKRYPVRPYPGDVVLCVSDDDSLLGISRSIDPRFAWTRYVAGHEVHLIRGPHESVLKPPQVLRLAEAMDTALRRLANQFLGTSRETATQTLVGEYR